MSRILIEDAAVVTVDPGLGDFERADILIDDGAIVGVIDWEFAGPASPAYDFAMWEVSAGDGLHDRSDLLRRGYA